MPNLTCYRLRPELVQSDEADLDEFVEFDGHSIASHGPIDGVGFRAHLHISRTRPHKPAWGDFLEEGFSGDLTVPLVSSVGALLLVLLDGGSVFAFAFGTTGRFLLKHGAIQRAYGLRTALNLIYPRRTGEDFDVARLRAIDTKSFSASTLRSRKQTSRGSTLGQFSIDHLRDILNAATGTPADTTTWGPRLSGADALHVSVDVGFADLADLCRRIDDAYARTDYRERFALIDHLQPVMDPLEVGRLEDFVLSHLREQELAGMDLAPPEVVDWQRLEGFRYHYDPRGKTGLRHSELRLRDYLAGLQARGHKELGTVDVPFLRRSRIFGVDGNGESVSSWPVWTCLVADFEFAGQAYVLDEGSFWAVAKTYREELDQFVAAIPDSTVSLPAAPANMREDQYSRSVASNDNGYLLLDKQNVRTASSTTVVEICGLLHRTRSLVHLKRHLGSRDLSHLFAQGEVSAELLQQSPEFCERARAKIAEQPGGDAFRDLIHPRHNDPTQFEVVYGVIANWDGRQLEASLPFFSKINLRRSVQQLTGRGFRVSFARIDVSTT